MRKLKKMPFSLTFSIFNFRPLCAVVEASPSRFNIALKICFFNAYFITCSQFFVHRNCMEYGLLKSDGNTFHIEEIKMVS